MISFQQQYQQTQRITMDFQTNTLTAIKLWLNTAKDIIMQELGLEVIEETKTITTVASQQTYDLTVRFWRMKTVTYTTGSIPYTLEPVESQEMWNELNATRATDTSDIPSHYFIKRPLGINEAQLALFPTPANASDTITYIYEAKEKDMTADDYSTGTVTVTNGDATVTGAGGATFTAQVVGRYFRATNDGDWYRIETYTDSSNIELNKKFEGTTAAGASYEIVEALPVPESLHVLPIYFAAAHVYMTKKDPQNEVKYMSLFNDGLRRAKENMGLGKTTSQVFYAKGFKRPVTNPNYSPRTIT